MSHASKLVLGDVKETLDRIEREMDQAFDHKTGKVTLRYADAATMLRTLNLLIYYFEEQQRKAPDS